MSTSRTPTELSPTDPLTLLKGFVSLRRLTGMYPAGHPAIEQKLGEIDGAVQQHLQDSPTLKLDVIHGRHISTACRSEARAKPRRISSTS